MLMVLLMPSCSCNEQLWYRYINRLCRIQIVTGTHVETSCGTRTTSSTSTPSCLNAMVGGQLLLDATMDVEAVADEIVVLVLVQSERGAMVTRNEEGIKVAARHEKCEVQVVIQNTATRRRRERRQCIDMAFTHT